MPGQRTALIVGAGIGGLAAALVLRRAGWDVRIHERAATPRELGFAIGLAPNAMAALRELEKANHLIEEGVTTKKVEIRCPDGSVMRAFNAQVGGPLRVALRSALHDTLLNTVGNDTLVLDSEAIDVAIHGRGVSLKLKNGRTDTADMLIGADGVGSLIRQRLHPHEPPPRRSDFCALRGVAYGVGDYRGDLAGVGYLEDGVEAATARASHNAVYWYLSLLAKDVPEGTRHPTEILHRHIREFDAPFQAITTATQPEDLRFDELFERDALRDWGAGRVTLLGDAAHPMLPHTGQVPRKRSKTPWLSVWRCRTTWISTKHCVFTNESGFGAHGTS